MVFESIIFIVVKCTKNISQKNLSFSPKITCLLAIGNRFNVFIFAEIMADILIAPSSEKDFEVVAQLAKSFDLDFEDVFWKQFLVAKKGEGIIGFGRLRNYSGCTEVATVGVINSERGKGLGTLIVNELIRMGPKEIFVTCVIPKFFSRFGFQQIKQYPPVLQKKVDFCKCYNFKEDEIFVMKLNK